MMWISASGCCRKDRASLSANVRVRDKIQLRSGNRKREALRKALRLTLLGARTARNREILRHPFRCVFACRRGGFD